MKSKYLLPVYGSLAVYAVLTSPLGAASLVWTSSNPANTVWTAADKWDGPATWSNGDDATFNASAIVNLGTDISQSGVVIASGQTLTLNATANLKLSGTGGFTGNLTKTGGGQLKLSQSGGFAGTLTISSGYVVLGATNTDPTGQTSSATKVVNGGSGLILGSAYNGASATIGELSGSGSVRTDWADGGTNAKRTLIVDQSTDTTYSGTFNEGTSGRSLELVKAGSGTLTLSGNSTAWSQANAVITGGTLKLGNANAIGVNGGYAQGFTLRNGALDINGQTNFTFTGGSAAWLVSSEAITLGGQAGGVMEIKNSGSSAGFTLYNLNNAITYDATNNPGTATISANWYGTGQSGVGIKNINVGDSSATSVELDFTGQMGQTAVADGASTTLVKQGAGSMRISAANYFPRLQIDAGKVVVNHVNALGASRSGGYANLVTVKGGTLDLNGFSNSIGGLDDGGTSSGVIRNDGAASSILSVGSSGANTTFSGTIQNGVSSVGLTKEGSGVLTLSGSNTYTNTTTVASGTLLVNGALGNTTVSVASGATLGGTGTIAGAVNVSGVLSPGASVATLATGTLSFAASSTFAYEMDSTVGLGVAADLQSVTGDLNLTGLVELTLADLATGGPAAAFAENTVFSLINYTGSWNSGIFTYDGNSLADGGIFTAGLNTWQIDYDATSGGSNFSGEFVAGNFVNITAVPEPAAALLGGIGMLLLLRRRRN